MMGPQKTLSEREEEVKEEYLLSLRDLTYNSKPLIDVLTEVADENREYAACIVDCIEEQLERVSGPLKLPILYLIDSIIKCETIKQYYLPLFSRNIHKLFAKVYELGDDDVKSKLAKLRFTWNGVLPGDTLAALDNLVRSVNPSWGTVLPPAVHVNPKFISASVTLANVAKSSNSVATKEELRQKQKELLELTQRKQELEQELKVLRPVKGKTGDAKLTEKLTNVVNQVLTQVEQVKSGTYNPLEVQRVRESAGTVKNSMRNIIESIHNDPKHAVYAKDLPFLNELVAKLTETEKVLAELETTNHKRKVILVEKDATLKTAESQAQFAASSAAIPSTRPNMAIRSWNKSSQPNVNGTLATQNPPAFRIAPVSSQLINAARRVRDPRLQKKVNVPPQKKAPTPETTDANGRLETTEPTASRIIESKNDKRNESPDQSHVAQPVTLKKNDASSKSKSTSRKVVVSQESTSTPADNLPSAKKRKVEKVVEVPVPKGETSNQKEETHHARKRKAELDNGNHKSKAETPSPEKRKSNGKRASEASKKSKSAVSSTIDDLFEDAPKKHEPNVSKTFSKEERDKRLRILVQTPSEETQRLLEGLTKKSPKMAEKLIRLLSKEKETSQVSPIVDVDADSGTESEAKSPPRKESKLEPEDDDSGDLDCVIVSSPEPAKVFEKMKSPPKIEAVEEYDPFGELLDLEESILPDDSPKDEPKIEAPIRSPPVQDIDLRSLMAPASVMMPPATVPTSVMMPPVTGAAPVLMPAVSAAIMPPVSAPIMVPAVGCKSPPNGPPPPPIFPFMGLDMGFGFPKPPGFGIITPPNTILEVPPANEDLVEIIDRDPMTTINIDSIPRQIRHYGSTAVVFINWDDPREILFSSHDAPRRIVINYKSHKISVQCYLNSPDVERMIDGVPHKFRLGAPTRELYIDGIGHECYFGGPPIRVRLNNGDNISVRIEGQAPKVDIGRKRLDLVAGKIDMIINEVHTFPVFLDAKPQKIEVEGYKFVIVFIDALQRVMINDITFRSDFTGFSQSFRHCNKIFNFRFSMLPRGIIPGAVNIYQMRTSKLPSPPPLPPSLRYSANEDFPGMPLPPVMSNVPIMPVSTIPAPVMMSCAEPTVALNPNVTSQTIDPTVVKDEDSNPEELSIDELVKKLLAKGLVHIPNPSPSEKDDSPSASKPVTKTETETKIIKNEPVKPVDLTVTETLRQKQPGMISILYTGNQCGSCGLRFPEEQTLKYSEHLDWHFRLNRRGRDGARAIHLRKWYYNANDWLKFQEMEDESDRGQSWFDNHPGNEYNEESIEQVACVAATRGKHDICELCLDSFEQFFDNEAEEWQLRNAIRIEDKVYHPKCYEGHSEQMDQSDDVEEIIDPTETINLDDPSMNEEEINDVTVTVSDEASNVDTELPDTLSIKQEKPDVPAKATDDSEKPAVSTEEDKPMDEDEDSDVEEVQLIEEPIEEIIIPDDANDDEESNLETLLVEDIVLSPPSELENATAQEKPVEEIMDKIVDITQPVSTVSIDGNVEPGDTIQHLITAPTKIKITMAKSNANGRATPTSSPKSSPKNIVNDDAESLDKVSDFSESADFDEQPPPPGEEMVTLVPADLKPRLRERKLTEYPPVRKSTQESGLCSIM